MKIEGTGDLPSKFKILFLLMAVLFCIQASGRAWAQSFITFGGGFGAVRLSSKELNRFRDTYNQVNRQFLIDPLEDKSTAIGWMLNAGYRRFNRRTFAFDVIYSRYISENHASFSNGDHRTIRLESSVIRIGFEGGLGFTSWFLNGRLAVGVNNPVRLRGSYRSAEINSAPKSLTGVYSGRSPLFTEIGAVLGYWRKPVFLLWGVSLPVFHIGRAEDLRDSDAVKIEEGLDRFPADYIAYKNREPYSAVKADISGLRVTFSVALALEWRK